MYFTSNTIKTRPCDWLTGGQMTQWSNETQDRALLGPLGKGLSIPRVPERGAGGGDASRELVEAISGPSEE